MADHIQLHQGWMKYFKNDIKDNVQVYCYNIGCNDISDGKNTIPPNSIGPIKIKSLGAQDNFYKEQFEQYLCREWEAKFGLFIRKILNGVKTNAMVLSIEKGDMNFFKRFMALSVGRSKFFRSFYRLNFANKMDRNIMSNEFEPASVIYENNQKFENKQVSFLFNKTNVGFVLPSYSHYHYPKNDCIVIPLTPKIAITFSNDITNDINTGVITDIGNVDKIKEMNEFAYYMEAFSNRDFLIARNERDLEFVKEIICRKNFFHNAHELHLLCTRIYLTI